MKLRQHLRIDKFEILVIIVSVASIVLILLLSKSEAWFQNISTVIAVDIATIGSRYFGEVAGSNAAINYERRKNVVTDLVALRAMYSELELGKRFSEYNRKKIDHKLSNAFLSQKLPCMAVTTAISSKDSAILTDAPLDIIDGLCIYIIYTSLINSQRLISRNKKRPMRYWH